jgi:hypothetical protein
VLWLREGDVPTKNFHVYANAQCRRNFIRSVNIGNQVVVSEPQKAQAFFNFYDGFMGEPAPRSCAIDLDQLDLPRLDLSQLSECFTEEEVWNVVRSLSPNKASGLNGFMTRFLHAVWLVIKGDIMQAFDAFWYVDTRHFHSVNNALMTLLPKTLEAATVKDFRPISLIHVVGKLVSKVLATRLAPKLHNLVWANQSAFIKGRLIQDNFRMVQSTAELLHARRCPDLC